MNTLRTQSILIFSRNALLLTEAKFKEKLGKENIIKFLEKKGNKVVTNIHMTAIVNGASKYDGHLYGHADSRRDGGGAVVY